MYISRCDRLFQQKQQPQPVAPEPPIEAAKEVEGKQNVPKRGKEKLLKELPVERQRKSVILHHFQLFAGL